MCQQEYQWKTLFISDPTKQVTEVCFSHKRDNVLHKPLIFNDNKIQYAPARKTLGAYLRF